MELVKRLSCFIMLFALISCGGGGDLTGNSNNNNNGNNNGNNGGASAPTIALSLSANRVTGQAPVTATATVTRDGSALANTVVTFSTSLGALSPSSGTALTNADGVATILLTAGTVRGAGTLTAAVDGAENATVSFESQGDDVAQVGDVSVTVALVDQSGNPTQTVTASNPGRAVATVNGITSPVIVTFSSTVGDIPIATATTNDNNQATVDVNAGSTLGAGTITATLTSGETGSVLVVVGATDLRMGSGTPFVENQAAISLAQISAGGTTVVSVDIIDENGNPYNEPVDVNFSSTCSSASTPTATLSTPVTTSNGVANSTYLARGCVGDDPINVTANAGGINLSASTSVNVLSAAVGSVEFVSATPQNIGIIGTGSVGGSESATLVFRVRDTDGNPVNNQVVRFELNTSVGGLRLSQNSATSDANGLVQTVVNSGTVATTIRVKATIAGTAPEVSSQSSVLVVSTGIPDQDSFSISAETLNVEGLQRDGTETNITARLADAFNNPVPDGTAVNFTTEGGAIDASCTTTNGACSVVWRSQLPRPVAGRTLNRQLCDQADDNNPAVFCARVPLQQNGTDPQGNPLLAGQNYLGQSFGGRSTVLATAIGEESFPDLNGNGRFDANEVNAFRGNNVSGLPFDLDEAFSDYNEDGVFNPQVTGGQAGGELEELVDFSFDEDNPPNGIFDTADGYYNGVLCALDANNQPSHDGCATFPSNAPAQFSVNVRRQLVLVMSGNTPYITVVSTNDSVSQTIDDDNDSNTPEVPNPNFNANDATLFIAGESTGSVSIVIADINNQQMPAGTTVTFVPSVGSVVGSNSFTWPNSTDNGGRSFAVSIEGEAEPTSGSLTIEVETPNGVATSLAGVINIVIQ